MTLTEVPSARRSRAAASGYSWRVVALGLLLVQVVWILAVPPFRGSDEFDHAFRAAAVARGEWAPEPVAATRGTGAYVTVPTDLVTAAEFQCTSLPYTETSDCVGRAAGDGSMVVSSGAGRYQPVYYWLIGSAALPFDGTAALMVMRAASALLCWLVLVAALWSVSVWSRTRWPAAAVVLSLTPVVMYSTAIVAPNGLELCAAVALWASLLALANGRSRAGSHTGLIAVAVTSGIIVSGLRPMGPLWAFLALVVAASVAATQGGNLRALVRDRKIVAAVAAVGVASLASVTWILRQGSLVVGEAPVSVQVDMAEKVSKVALHLPLWVLQSIAAFPLRNEPSHPLVYVLMLGVFGALIAITVRASSRSELLLVASVAFVSLALPALLTWRTYETFGTAWQGRYTMPLSIGMVMLCGLILDRRDRTAEGKVLLVAGLCVAVAQILAPVLLLRDEIAHRLPEGTTWPYVGPVALTLLAVIGMAAVLIGLLGARLSGAAASADKEAR